MSVIDTITALINGNVDNYPNKAFQNNTMRTILLLMTGQLPGGSGTGLILPFEITSANFTTAVDCPLPVLAGLSLIVEMDDIGRKLVKGTEWQDLVGGGFTILIPGFNAATTLTYPIYVYIKGN